MSACSGDEDKMGEEWCCSFNRVQQFHVWSHCTELGSLCQTGSVCLTVPDEMKREAGSVPKLFVQISITLWCPQTKPLTCEWVS